MLVECIDVDENESGIEMHMIYLPIIVFNFGIFARVCDLAGLSLLVEH